MPVEKQNANEIEKTEVVQERPAVTPETVIEKPVVENPVAPAVEAKPVSEKPQVRQEESLVEIPFETVTSPDANLAEGQTRIVTAGVKGQRRLVTKVSMVNGQEVREVIEDKWFKLLCRKSLQSERRKRCNLPQLQYHKLHQLTK